VNSFDAIIDKSIKEIEDPEEKKAKIEEFITKLVYKVIMLILNAATGKTEEYRE